MTGSACPVIHETYSEPKKSTAFATPPGSAYPAYRDGLNEAARPSPKLARPFARGPQRSHIHASRAPLTRTVLPSNEMSLAPSQCCRGTTW